MLKNVFVIAIVAFWVVGCSKKDNAVPSGITGSQKSITVSSFESYDGLANNRIDSLSDDFYRMTKKEYIQVAENKKRSEEYNRLSDDEKRAYWIKRGEKYLTADHGNLFSTSFVEDHDKLGFPFKVYKLINHRGLYAAVFTGVALNETGKTPTYACITHRATKKELILPLEARGFNTTEIEALFNQLDGN